MRTLVCMALALSCTATTALAQTSPPQHDVDALAKQTQNPVRDLTAIPLVQSCAESTYVSRVGLTDLCTLRISPISGVDPVTHPFTTSNSTTGCGLFTSRKIAA
jgi:hypothetical protein